jgi:hypothetical protein
VIFVLLMLGGLAAAVLISLPSLPGSSSNATSGTAVLPTSPSGALAAGGNDITAASAQACRANFAAAQTAVDVYQAERGTPPSSIAEVQSLVRDPLSTAHFAITIDPRRPGQLEVATPDHLATDGDINCQYAH